MNSLDFGVKSITWIGVDVSADTFDICQYPLDRDLTTPAQLRQLTVKSFERSQQGVAQLLDELSSVGPLHLVMESTGRYSSQLATWIIEARPDAAVSIINPRRASDHAKSLGMRSKTDPICARVIASYAAKFQPKPWNRSCDEYLQLQALTRVRQSLVEQHTTVTNQLADLGRETLPKLTMATLKLALSSVEQALREQIDNIETQMHELFRDQIQLKADRDLAVTIPGVGQIVSSTLMGEVGDIRRFDSRSQAQVFAGINVGRHTSGRTINRTLGLSKEGSARVRRVLYLASMAAVKGNNALARQYRQLLARGKMRKCALGAVMRKIFAVYRRVVISGCPYNDSLIEPKRREKTAI